jgi:ferric-dicitrate binding protein FerR (iron transport regulator)
MQNELEKRYDISRIVSKKAFDAATGEEKNRLDAWLEESPLHREEYEMWMNRLPEDVEKTAPADVRKAWRRFETLRRRRGMRVVSRRWWAVAASVAVLMVIVGTAYWGLLPERTKNATAHIAPGTEIMILRMPDGEKLQVIPAVGSVGPNGGTFIPNEHGVLRYDLVKGDKSEMSSIYHTMSIPRGGEYQVVLSDGTHIYVNAQSEVKYPMAFAEGGTRDVYIKGEAYLEVAHNAKSPFIVHTRYGAVEVKGTKFNVCDYDAEQYTAVTLAEGSVQCTFGQHSYLLEPGMQCLFDKHSRTARCEEVDVDSYVSWHTGLFEFNNMTLKQIMNSLARWYDVDYRFKNTELADYTFTGIAYRNGSLEELLKTIEKTTQIHFKIQDRTIYITK